MNKKTTSILVVGLFLFTTISAISVASKKIEKADEIPPVPDIVHAEHILVDRVNLRDPYDDIYELTFTTKVNENGVYIQFNTDDKGNSEWMGPFNSGQVAEYKYERTFGAVLVKARASYNPSGSSASDWTGPTSISFSKAKISSPNFLSKFMGLNPIFDLLLERLF